MSRYTKGNLLDFIIELSAVYSFSLHSFTLHALALSVVESWSYNPA